MLRICAKPNFQEYYRLFPLENLNRYMTKLFLSIMVMYFVLVCISLQFWRPQCMPLTTFRGCTCLLLIDNVITYAQVGCGSFTLRMYPAK